MCVIASVDGAMQGSTSEQVAVRLERLYECLSVADNQGDVIDAWNTYIAPLPGQREME